METQRFNIVKPGTAEVVHGFENLPLKNVYLSTYGRRLRGQKALRDLVVGEGSLHRFSLSGTAATYCIVRVA